MKTVFRASSQEPLYRHPESKSYSVFRGEVPSTQTRIAMRDYKTGGPYSAEKVRKGTVVERKFAGRCARKARMKIMGIVGRGFRSTPRSVNLTCPYETLILILKRHKTILSQMYSYPYPYHTALGFFDPGTLRPYLFRVDQKLNLFGYGA